MAAPSGLQGEEKKTPEWPPEAPKTAAPRTAGMLQSCPSEASLLSSEGRGRNPWGQLSDLRPTPERAHGPKLEPEPPKLARFHSPHGFRVQRLPDAGQGSCSGKGRCAGAAASGIYISVAAGLRGRWVRGALVCPLGSPSGGLKATVTWGTRGKGQKR